MIKNIRPSLAEAGKIKIGVLGPERKSAKGNMFRPPQKLDHFLITTNRRNEAGDLELDAALMDAIGTDSDGKIRAIPIVVHSDNIDEVFPTSYALYSGKRCACRGDGETALRREMKGKQFTGAEKQIKCPCDFLRAASGPVCKPNGKLYCSIAAPGASIAGAVHNWRTTSIISVEQMIGSLQQIKAITGILRGIPLWLTVKPITVERDEGATTVFCCHLELRAADIQEVQRKALEAAEMRRRLGFDDNDYKRIISLPAHGETIEEQGEIAGEFYPEDDSNTSNGPGTSPDDLAAHLAAQKQAPETTTDKPAVGDLDAGRKAGDHI